MGIHGIILEGSERPLHVKFAEEQQVKRDKRNGRYNMGQMTQMGGIMGGKGYRDMDLANGMMPISYGGMSVNSASSARLPLSGGFNPRDPRYLVPYPQLSTEDSLGWGISSPYSSPRTQMPSTPYAQYLNAAYGRRNPTMYLNSPQHFLGGQSQHMQLNSRQYSYGEEQCSLRISELAPFLNYKKGHLFKHYVL